MPEGLLSEVMEHNVICDSPPECGDHDEVMSDAEPEQAADEQVRW